MFRRLFSRDLACRIVALVIDHDKSANTHRPRGLAHRQLFQCLTQHGLAVPGRHTDIDGERLLGM
jgi:hypothetical protein